MSNLDPKIKPNATDQSNTTITNNKTDHLNLEDLISQKNVWQSDMKCNDNISSEELINFVNQLEALYSTQNGINNIQRIQRGNLDGLGTTSASSWSFTEGLIIGQLSIILLLIFFIKFFIFTDNHDKDDRNKKMKSQVAPILKRGGDDIMTASATNQIKSTKKNKEGNESTTHGDTEILLQFKNILEKTNYDVKSHKSESLDWFNVLIAQIIEQVREEAITKNNILNSLNKFIEDNSSNLPDFLDTINIIELDIGNDFPIFSNCRIENEQKQKLEAKIDIDLNDRLALGISTKVLLNFPKPGFAALPVDLTVAVVKFHGSLTVSLTKANEFIHPSRKDQDTTNNNSNNNEDNGYFLMFSFSPEYTLEFETSSLIGARSKLENIPKIASIIEYQIKKWFVERCVEPRFQFVKLPSIWPRSKNVREEINEVK